MAVVQSLGSLADLSVGWYPTGMYGSLRMYDNYAYDYAHLYRVQPNVRTCVDFLARNIAQLGLHVFKRVSETDRERVRDHPLAQVLAQPLPAWCKVTGYRLIESLMADLGVYYNAFWLKVRQEDQFGLLRMPPPFVSVRGGLVPTSYVVEIGMERKELAPENLVHMRGYNAENPLWGLSPLETLRRILAEEFSMGDYREHFWANAARMHGVIERPREAPDWSLTARERFKEEFEALYAGGDNSGKTAILEEGMTWKSSVFTAQESEYILGRKLTREECARAYHIPLPMVGILDHATFSNITEQHKNLYQDCLGPWCAMIEQDIALQLFPDFEDTEGMYVEFNIQEKLQGSFEEQTQALQSSVGRPWMTADEARARMNLPSMGGDAEELVTPLNVLIGGQASPRDSAPDPSQNAHLIVESKAQGEIDVTLSDTRTAHEAKWRQVLTRIFERQRNAVLGQMPKGRRVGMKQDGDLLWDAARWDRELREDLFRMYLATATVWGQHISETLESEFDEAMMMDWVATHSRVAAESINAQTKAGLDDALMNADDPLGAVKGIFALALAVRAPQLATSAVTTASSFGATEAASQGGLRSKTWKVNSGNPRPEHGAMNGETVGIRELFSNGARWPGDPVLGADGNANCMCSVVFTR